MSLATLTQALHSPHWRVRKLYQILTEGGIVAPLVLRDEQERFLRERHNRNFVPKARKLGLSTIIVLDNLDHCIFSPDQRAGIVDLTKEDAYAKLEMAKLAWREGPNHEDPGIAAIWRKVHQVNPIVKEAEGEIRFKNGSGITAGVAFTGRTPQRLHISEYGPISARHPLKASAIKRGAINSVPPDGIVDIETTMEGGRFGECYLLFSLALASEGQKRTKADWKLQFFPWWRHPSYVLPGSVPQRQSTMEYFAEIREKHGIDIPAERQAWYEKRAAEQGEDMFQQFPTILEEVDRQIVPGQIYPQMKSVRAEGRVCRYNPEPGLPMFAAFDLGSSDNMAGWLIQPAGKAHNFLSWCAGEGAGAAAVAEVVRSWERRFASEIQLLVPHDAELTDKGSGKTYVAQLVEAGIPRNAITVVPRIPDVWVGVSEVRNVLVNAWFHAETDEPVVIETGAKLPSGVGRLEGYRKKLDRSTGVLRDVPVHDVCSHTADAARTYAEALSHGLVKANVSKPHRRAVVVKSGWRG